MLRTLLLYAIVLPLAVLVGWMTVDLAHWDSTSFTFMAAVVFVLLLPVLLKWHYPIMVFSWNAFITLFFLPGKPALWMTMAAITFAIAILNRIMMKKQAFHSAPPVTFSLLLLAAVILITAWLRGGIGLNVLGSSAMGGKGYIYLLASIVGYFAFASRTIPPEHAKFYVGLFFLPGIIAACSNLIYFAGPAFYFLYLIFPAGFAVVQAGSEGTSIGRVAGFSIMAVTVSYFMFAIYGIRGLLAKWWRPALVLLLLGLGSMGGYRSVLIHVGLVFAILFVTEGLLRSRLFPMLVLAGLLGFAILIPTASMLPGSIQRTLSFLPLKIDPVVRDDADNSVRWRVEIWRALLPDLHKYVWLGKGYTIDPVDLYLTQQAVYRGRVSQHHAPLVSGNYHSGPLTLFVPFGSFGFAAFVLFLAVSLRALYHNLRFGDEKIKMINRFLFAYFLSRAIFFFSVFGDFAGEFYVFTGIAGLSVALNKGVRRKPVTAPQPVTFRGPLLPQTAQPSQI